MGMVGIDEIARSASVVADARSSVKLAGTAADRVLMTIGARPSR